MTDLDYARAVHERALSLCRAMNEAGEAGLIIDVSFESHSKRTRGTILTHLKGFTPIISIIHKKGITKMSKAYVYILSSYGEHGAEHVTATLDRSLLPAMLRKYPNYNSRSSSELTKLDRALARFDNNQLCYNEIFPLNVEEPPLGVDSINVSEGWGGIQLHIVPLKTSE